MKLRLLKKFFFISLTLLLAVLFSCYFYVALVAENYLFQNIDTIPSNKTGLLLGTSKFMNDGSVNLFFTNRCNAASELWKNGKINQLIISGDSTSRRYDEPELMRQELLEYGIPDSIIILDKVGFNTRSSILFCKTHKIDSLIIISQQFHNERAIVISISMGIDAIGYNAKPVYTSYGIRVWIREWFARVKLVFELGFIY